MTNLIKNKYIQEEEQNRRTILQGKVVGYGETINESETVNVQLLTGNPDSQEQLSTDVLRNVPVELSDSSTIKTALKEGDIVSVGFFEEDYSSPHVINSFGTASTIATNADALINANTIIDFENIEQQYNNNNNTQLYTTTINKETGKITYNIKETNILFISPTATYNGLMRPISGIDRGYSADEGLDIGAIIGTPVYSPCNGTFVYSEYGHTPWGRSKFGKKKDDTPYSIGITLDKPIVFNNKIITYLFLTHLSKLVYDIPNGKGGQKVKMGELIGYTGTANDSPHLHIGFSPSKNKWEPLRNNDVRYIFKSSYGETWTVGK